MDHVAVALATAGAYRALRSTPPQMPAAPLPDPPARDPAWRISAQAWWALLGLAVSVMVLAAFGGVLLRAFWIVFGGLLLGLSVRPASEWLARWHVPRAVTVIAVYLLVLGAAVAVSLNVVPAAESGLTQLRASVPAMLHTIDAWASRTPGLSNALPTLDDVTTRAAAWASTAAFTLAGLLQSAGEMLIEVLVAFILGFFVATAPLKSAENLLAWFPARMRLTARALAATLATDLARVVWAQLAVAAFFGTFIGIGYALVGVPYALTIALVGGVLEVIPFVGSMTALVLGVLSAATLGAWPVVWTVVVHQVVAQTEAEFVSPALLGRVADLHPGVVLVGALLGIWMFGIVGGFFAVPLLVVIRTLLVAWHERQAGGTPVEA